MADNSENLVLTILKDLQEKISRIDRNVDDLRVQFHGLSAEHLAMKRDGVRQDESIAHLHVRQDRMEKAVDRINARLGLIDPDLH